MLKRLLPIAAAMLLWGTLACSPEEARARGGGPGADIGNRRGSVELHGKSGPESMYYKTPVVGLGAQQQQRAR
jgi:hypothetical protein